MLQFKSLGTFNLQAIRDSDIDILKLSATSLLIIAYIRDANNSKSMQHKNGKTWISHDKLINDLGLDISKESLKHTLKRLKDKGIIESYTESTSENGSKSYYCLSYAMLTVLGLTNDEYDSESVKQTAKKVDPNDFLRSAKRNKARTKEQIEEDNIVELGKYFESDVISLITQWYSKRRLTHITNADFISKNSNNLEYLKSLNHNDQIRALNDSMDYKTRQGTLCYKCFIINSKTNDASFYGSENLNKANMDDVIEDWEDCDD